MARNVSRFCWRERTDRVNWRMLKALDLPDIVRRGDPALLEPYALHLTFARLPQSSALARGDAGDRDAWFIVRVLQLSMEYMLFMRSRDGDALDSLFQQLQLCERDRDELVARAHKWKERAVSGERHVEKLHQALQNISKLLQIHGASPSAVATIQTLLTELVAEQRARQHDRHGNNSKTDIDIRPRRTVRIDETRVCALCGKLFSSPEYLDKHMSRRHSTSQPHDLTPLSATHAKDGADIDSNQTVAVQQLIQQFGQMLEAHEENFRLVAAQEASRVQQLYERLHADAQVVDELQVTRQQSEQHMDEERRQLDQVLRDKSAAVEALKALKEELQLFTIQKQKMESRAAEIAVPAMESVGSSGEEVRQLQNTLEETNEALAEARTKLARLQTEHLQAIREKQMLGDRLDQARDKLQELQESTKAAQSSSPRPASPTSPVVKTIVRSKQDASIQTDAVTTATSSIQVDMTPPDNRAPTSTLEATRDEKCVQTEGIPEHRAPLTTEIAVQVAPDYKSDDEAPTHRNDDVEVPVESTPPVVEIPSSTSDDATVASRSTPETSTPSQIEGQVPDYIQDISRQSLLDAIDERSQRAVASIIERRGESQLPEANKKAFSCITRRKFLVSRFQHPEELVNERIASCVDKLDAFAQRFGIPPKSSLLSNEHLELVRQALHAHMEVLPTDVLERMIVCESSANGLVETEWVPREKARRQSLDKLRFESQTKSQRSEALVRQAMAAFAMSKLKRTADAAANVQAQNAPKDTIVSQHENEGEDREATEPTSVDLTPKVYIEPSRHGDHSLGGDDSAKDVNTVAKPSLDPASALRVHSSGSIDAAAAEVERDLQHDERKHSPISSDIRQAAGDEQSLLSASGDRDIGLEISHQSSSGDELSIDSLTVPLPLDDASSSLPERAFTAHDTEAPSLRNDYVLDASESSVQDRVEETQSVESMESINSPERSASVIASASSELSFAASIPSLSSGTVGNVSESSRSMQSDRVPVDDQMSALSHSTNDMDESSPTSTHISGWESISPHGDNDYHTATEVEPFGADDDPPVAVELAPRGLQPAVASAATDDFDIEEIELA